MYYVGVDIGGTFTDCVLVDRQGNHRSAKVLSAKDDPVAGVLAGLSQLAETVGVDLPTLLERTERFGHGTTIGTNAVLGRPAGFGSARRASAPSQARPAMAAAASSRR
jgi:N-methylhydantoinase A